jgi:hypothetical protein
MTVSYAACISLWVAPLYLAKKPSTACSKGGIAPKLATTEAELLSAIEVFMMSSICEL